MTDKFNYAKTAATAARLIGRFGAAATLRRNSGSQYDPSTGTAVPSWAEYPCTVAEVNYEAKDIDGTLIQASDRRLLVAPDVSQAPRTGDVFRLASGAEVTVINVKATAPAGKTVLYDVQVRGA
ncbi:MAG: hypothetical protein LBE21_10060 [Pseudomonadales bacterium]|jgi:hypothetical protein|nr:hypothetical protein [Pseudomonadales bacterium]